MLKFLGRFASLGAYILFVVSVVVAFSLYQHTTQRVIAQNHANIARNHANIARNKATLHVLCTGLNDVRAADAGFWDVALAEVSNVVQTTIADPTASAGAKRRAQATLDALPGLSRQVHERFAQKKCPR